MPELKGIYAVVVKHIRCIPAKSGHCHDKMKLFFFFVLSDIVFRTYKYPISQKHVFNPEVRDAAAMLIV